MKQQTTLATVFLLATLLAGPALAVDYGFRVRGGLFTPEGDSDYWNDKAVDFTGDPEDFEGFQLGLDFDRGLSPQSTLRFSLDVYDHDELQQYRDFVDQDGFPIEHETLLELTSVTAAYVIHLGSPRARVRPYLGVGGGIYVWHLEESGDFIDFSTDPARVFSAGSFDEGVELGYFLNAGVDFAVSSAGSFFVEGRWHEVEAGLEDDFEGFGDLDLGGLAVFGGFGWTF